MNASNKTVQQYMYYMYQEFERLTCAITNDEPKKRSKPTNRIALVFHCHDPGADAHKDAKEAGSSIIRS